MPNLNMIMKTLISILLKFGLSTARDICMKRVNTALHVCQILSHYICFPSTYVFVLRK